MKDKKTHKITCLPSQKVLEVDEDTPLLKVLIDQKIYVKSSCGGHASCSDCVIKIVKGKECINRPSFAEERLLGNVFFITKERLACQTKVTGEVTIDLSNHDQKRDREKFLQKSSNLQKKKKKKKK
ncbi:MAG: 2Fe-2S iron-sulfur cluster-binding protein [Halobacteriovoraceae bacterium]|nr:2Fe-2S iron-sulfur cluster-binding protein [Halobacteriovoraceae bacterium]